MRGSKTILGGLACWVLALSAAFGGEPPTARIMVNPVPAKVGPPYPPLADGGPNIVGNELRLDAGGVRVWLEVQLADWDPNGDGAPEVRYFRVTLDGSGLFDADTDGDGDVTSDGDQEDITYAIVPCTSRTDCWAAFGEELADMYCNYPGFPGECIPVYTDKGGFRPDGWCAGGGCSCGSLPTITGAGWRVEGCYGGISFPPRPDDGSIRWAATALYDVPLGAKGKYTITLDTAATFFSSTGGSSGAIQSFSEMGFVINVLTGQCCFGLGTPTQGCIDEVTRAECDAQPLPVVFTPESSCSPVGADCSIHLGACCNTLTATCQDAVPEAQCLGEHSLWAGNVGCDEGPCAPDLGACCRHDAFTPCLDATALSACQCTGCIWHKSLLCAEVDCPVTPIPTSSEWGMVILTLLLLTAAKVVSHHRATASGLL